ncbi:hypothetical protein [Mammaliicoccus lentus]|uniref:hypothetical protein n=1 Tax=Mammaliicoccus lentus TaxID=42858 RepID=UPI00164D066A|nr:hypothetical protein [Mammaliicoccus lentus]
MAILLILWGEMMYKQIFDYSGKPYLVKTDSAGNILEGDLKKQGLYQYTEIMPPSKFYPPRKFDGTEWHGATVEEYIEDNEPPEVLPDPLQKVVADIQMQVMIGNMKTKEIEEKQKITEQALAETLLKVTELENKDGGNA